MCGIRYHVSVPAVIFGQALLFGDGSLILVGALAWVASHIFVAGYEEPRLEREFGAQYRAFRAKVPRWLQRLTPWDKAGVTLRHRHARQILTLGEALRDFKT